MGIPPPQGKMSRNETQERLERAALRESEERFRRVFEEGPLAMALVDEGYRLTHVNQRFCELLGYSEAELIALTFPEITHRDDVVGEVELAGQVFRGDIPSYAIEKRYLRKSGEAVWVNVTASVIRDQEGSPLYGLAMVEEIEERKSAQERIQAFNDELEERVAELEVANKELEAFSATVSHDLKSPLLTVAQFSRRILEESGDALHEHQRDMLQRVVTAGLQAKHMIDDLRDLGDVARKEIFPERVDLTSIAEQVIEGLRVLAPDRRLTFEAEPGIEAIGDPTLLRVLVTNLLQNAWKYTAPREHAHIKFGMEVGPIRTLYHVRDNGIGFDNVDRERLFQAFERLHTEEEFAGTGLGLATAERVVRRHGGDVWAEGDPDVGATFWFTLYDSPTPRLGASKSRA